MRVRKTLSKILVLVMIISLGMGSLISFAETTTKNFRIQKSRYIDTDTTINPYGYGLYGKQNNEDNGQHPIFKILSMVDDGYDKKSYYCLNAFSGSWIDKTINNADATYNDNYKLRIGVQDGEKGINNLKNDTTSLYSNIAKSTYLYEILWILDNIYVPVQETTEQDRNENEANKFALLKSAGMEYEERVDEFTGKTAKIWRYVGNTYSGDIKALYHIDESLPGTNEIDYGWCYTDDNIEENNGLTNVIISDDLIEVVQQAVLWYYTNYKDNNSSHNNDEILNIKENGLKNLYKYNINDEINYRFLDSDVIGTYEQEQATILAWYLIDSANEYADSMIEKYGSREAALSHIDDEMEGNPLKIYEETCNNTKTSNGTVIGPIKIDKEREAKYELNNTILINNTEYDLEIPRMGIYSNTYYISNNNGERQNKTLNEVVGEDFYICIRNNQLQPGNNTIKFSGEYHTNEKTLWVSSTSEEQPIVEVTPKTRPFDLEVKTEVPGKYNLDLVKVDQDGEQLSSTAEFEVTYPNNNKETKSVIGTLTIAKDVEINKDNCDTDDSYIIKETKAPDRYCEFNGIIKLKVKKNGADDTNPYTIKNVSYQVIDENGADITNSDDVNVSFDGNNIVVKVINHEKEFDLALQKYITNIISPDGENEIEGRQAPNVDVSNLNKEVNGIKQTTANYIQDKTPKNVLNGDYVLYTITVYNEGELDGYVNKITDNIPKGLEFIYKDNDEKYYAVDYTGRRSELLNVTQNIKEKINENNAFWSIDKDSQNRPRLEIFNENETISITCDVESYSRAKNIDKFNCLYAYDSSKNINNGSEGLDRLSVTLLLRVNSSEEVGTILRNEAAITEAEDMSRIRQDIDELSDRDSKVTEWPGKDGNKEYQDDEDYDNVVLQDEPKIHKGVKEVYNQDSGYDADEEQTWVIESDIPRNIEEYKKYDIVDDIDYRLNFSEEANVEVKIGEIDLVENEDYTITYTKNPNGVTNKTNSGTLKLEFISNNEMSNKLIENSGGKIRVTFKTTFAKDANGKLLALLGEEVPNKARLDYDNKHTYSEEPEVHTGGITLFKYEKETTNPIKGAEFAIYRTESDARNKQNKLQTATSGEDGIVRFIGLSYGGDATDSEDNKTESGIYDYDSSEKSTTYWVVETKTPEGYLSNEEPIEVEINSTSYEESIVKIEDKNKVPNTPITGKYSVILVKEDEDGVKLNETAEFMINGHTRTTDKGIITIVNNETINKDNVKETSVFTIIETKAPDKYSEFDGKITLQVSKRLADDGKSYIVKDPDDIVFTIFDKDDNPIQNNKDARVTLEGNSIYVHVKNYEKDFDLKLMKYISKVNGKATNRNLIVDASKLNTIVNNKKVTTANYNVSKEPIEVKTGDYVTYTLRVYNEGEIDGYAKEITENIPEGLKFVTEEDANLTDKDREAINFNKARSWNVTSKNQDGTVKTVSTDYLSKAKNENNKITAYVGDGKEPKYKDVQIMLKVVSNKTIVIRNEAAITEDEDKDGKEIADRDSDTEKWKKENSEDLYDNNNNYPKYKEDDEDYDNIIIKNVDLALTKFIVAISDDVKIEDGEYLTADKKVGSKENPYLRATKVDTSKLKAGTATTATYEMVKDPLLVPAQSYVLYNIRVYNEGDVDVFAGEIKDHLPDYLDYVDCEFNKNYGWQVGDKNKIISTDYLSQSKGANNIIKAFDKVNDDEKGSGLSYKDVQILCRVSSSAKSNEPIRNVAEVSKYEDKDGKEIDKDRDSTPNNGEKNEDDDDYEVVLIKNIDLALTKFIVAVSDDEEIEDGEYLTADKKVGSKENPYLRATKVDTSKLKAGTATTATYEMVKDPLLVPQESYVLYNIRVYNEGEVDVFAGEVKDHLPEYLEYVDCKFNDEYGWNLDENTNVITTNYLSKEEGEDNLIKAFDKVNDDEKGSGLSYKDVQILCRVSSSAKSNEPIRNVAEVSKYEDKDGKEIDKDRDSTPNNGEKNEDDDDYEAVLIKTFDLNLIKFVSEVIVTEDGKTKTTATNNTGDNKKDIIPKVEVNKKKINSTIVKFKYKIKITNEGDLEGYAKEITDYVPQGLKFYKEDNNGWTDEGNNVISTKLLENTLLKPGESAEVTVVLRWINGSTNLGLKRNNAEISEDYNEFNVPDKDSTPDNKVPEEDDFDYADVMLSISTGISGNIAKYVLGSAVIIIVLAGGVISIKKFVI